MSKDVLAFSVDEFNTTIDVLESLGNYLECSFISSLDKNGLCCKETLNPHEWMQNVKNARDIVKKLRDIQGGDSPE